MRDIRQLGLMIGIELKVRATPYLEMLQANGVLALPAGTNVLRLLPPLVISQTQMDEVLSEVVAVLASETSAD